MQDDESLPRWPSMGLGGDLNLQALGFPPGGPDLGAPAPLSQGFLPGGLPPAPPFGVTLPPGGGGSSGDQQPAPLSRKEQEKARNREKQARFRQRQRDKKQQLAEAYESTEADLERERLLGDQLRASGALLEAVQQQKDQALNILSAASGEQQQRAQQKQQQAQQQRLAGGGWQIAEEGESPTHKGSGVDGASGSGAVSLGSGSVPASGQAGGLGASLGADGRAMAEHLFALPFLQRVELCTRLFKNIKLAKQVLVQAGGRRPDGFALDADVRREVGQRMVSELPQLVDVAQAMTPEMVIKEWGEFSSFVAGVVGAVDAGRMEEAEAEAELMSAVVYEAIQHAIIMTHKPECLRRLIAHSRLPGETEAAAAARWCQLGLDVGVTEEQAKAGLPVFLEYCAQVEQLASESAASLATVRQIQQTLSQNLLSLDSGLSAQTLSYLNLFEAASQLEHQPDAALHLLVSFYGRMGMLSSPLQKARIIAQSGNLHPDIPALVKGVLQHYGLLPKGSQGSASAAAGATAVPGAAQQPAGESG